MERLTPRIQPYAWGSHEAIAQLTGRDWPTEQPEAELWMGAHQAAPSGVGEGGVRPLTELIATDPHGALGPEAARRFEGRLPFLLKILAPVQALSIQVHPSLEQVGEVPSGTYADSWPKPEAFYALTDFHVFAGTRSFDELRSLSEVLAVPQLADQVEAVAVAVDPIRAYIDRLVHLAGDDGCALADAVTTACRERSADPALAAVASVAEHHPSDIGLVVLLAMRHQVFRPGQYAFLPAGVLHAYVHGVAVEIMANSDNVVRAGLTQKQIDVDELLRILDTQPPVHPQTGTEREGWTEFPAESPYFQLRTTVLTDDPVGLPEGCSRIALVLDGTAVVEAGADTVELQAGESCFLPATDSGAIARGDGRLFLATPGDSSA